MDQLNPGDPQYNVPAFDRIRGPLDVTALARALDAMVARHEVLRTVLVASDGLPRQRILPRQPVTMPLIDLTPLSPSGQEDELRRLAALEYRRPFDLARGPVLRVHLVRLAEDDHVLLLSFHHIVHDGWSYGLFTVELRSLYEAFTENRPSGLPGLTVQYADYAVWQRRLMDEGHLDGQLEFWKRRLSGVTALPPIRTDRPRPARSASAGRLVPVNLSAGTARRVRALCREANATPFMVMLTALTATLGDYTGQDEVVIGTDVANRSAPETERLVGFFVNQIVLRVSTSGDPTWWELLDRTRGVVLDALRHQDVPFERVVQALNPPRSRRHSPLFQVKLVLNSTPPPEPLLPGLDITPMDFDLDTTRSDLALILREGEDGVSGFLEYSTALFEETTIDGLLHHFARTLETLTRHPRRRVGEGTPAS
jgi:hypothetical protein